MAMPVDGHILQHNAGLSFDHISDDFDDHIRKSIPLYGTSASSVRRPCHPRPR